MGEQVRPEPSAEARAITARIMAEMEAVLDLIRRPSSGRSQEKPENGRPALPRARTGSERN